ncbi:class I SAM-dependent methyltransferase [Aspergillus stella-maris]|uniref:class I SAM-dependent methyltransferase n=1 Tax=Aspergillus stella-maris TaxID=1810926 RepID=UPI003CCC97E8
MEQEHSQEYDTQSLTASVTDYPTEYGRTFHKYHEGLYVYPNDERELSRMDLQHHLCKLLTGGRLFFAPVINPYKILDIGTGTGIWPIELAPIFPNAHITGTDLSPCQPTEVPENVHFIVDDITEEDWMFDRNYFDFIHSGHLSGALPSYKELMRKIYSHLKPGGWAEIHEFDTMVRCDDGTMPPMDEDVWSEYKLQDWCDMQIRSGQTVDPQRQFRVAHRLARGMRDLGFVDVQERIFKAPVNPWSSDPHLHNIGKWMQSNLLDGLSGWSYKPFRNMGYSRNEIEMFLVDVRKSIQNLQVHAYFNFHTEHASRHTPLSSSTPLLDHVWISEELLASSFGRFVNGQQRRYESRVPGPLEARRRLARRRNTALASAASLLPGEDIACLLGKNGKEHMKWGEPGRSFDHQFSAPVPPAPPLSYYNADLNAFDSEVPLQNWPGYQEPTKRLTRDQFFGEKLWTYRTTADLRYAIRDLGIDLRQEPSYSRLLFDHFVSLWAAKKTTIRELVAFLDDPNLNVSGAENYLRVIELWSTGEFRLGKQHALFNAFLRAVQLGSVPTSEVSAIIEQLGDMAETFGSEKHGMKLLTQLYERLWDAIGRCAVYGHKDLDEPLVNKWLGILLQNGTSNDLRLAKEILLAANVSSSSLWLSRLLTIFLHDLEIAPSKAHEQRIVEFLEPFDVHLVSTSLIDTQLLSRWGGCLARLHNTSAITTKSYLAPTSPRHRIIQRLWMVYTIDSSATSLSTSASKKVHPTVKSLYRMYEHTRPIVDLKLPFDLEAMADDLRTGPKINTPFTFAQIFKDLHGFNAAGAIFYPNLAKLISRTKVTSPEFQNKAVSLARAGDTFSIWTIIRLLRMHTPAKLALPFSWGPRPSPSHKSVIGKPRHPNSPDPHDVLDMIHSLAVAFACSEQISPRRSFQLVYWLYLFLVRHDGPVKPPLVRALYHAGVTRFKREKRHVSITQCHHIWRIVELAEGPKVLQQLQNRPGPEEPMAVQEPRSCPALSQQTENLERSEYVPDKKPPRAASASA